MPVAPALFSVLNLAVAAALLAIGTANTLTLVFAGLSAVSGIVSGYATLRATREDKNRGSAHRSARRRGAFRRRGPR